jgi:hypothetical protein
VNRPTPQVREVIELLEIGSLGTGYTFRLEYVAKSGRSAYCKIASQLHTINLRVSDHRSNAFSVGQRTPSMECRQILVNRPGSLAHMLAWLRSRRLKRRRLAS